MKFPKSLSIAAVALLLTACAAPTPKPRANVQFGPKPTLDQAMVKINQYLDDTLFDFPSARIKCEQPTDEAWVWPGVGYPLQYGYLVICQVNAKNKFGGYVGAQRYVFRFNGAEFQHERVIPDMGLVRR